MNWGCLRAPPFQGDSMSTVRLLAIEPVNSFRPGERFDVSEREARQLIEKGLAKMDGPVKNKMMPPAGNKQAAGEAQQSSASQAAPASRKTTATKSENGEKPKRTYTRRAASSR